MHFVSSVCHNRHCAVCVEPATHRVGEHQPIDAPSRKLQPLTMRRVSFEAFLCCLHFEMIFGNDACVIIENFDALAAETLANRPAPSTETRRRTDEPYRGRPPYEDQQHEIMLNLGDTALRKIAEFEKE